MIFKRSKTSYVSSLSPNEIIKKLEKIVHIQDIGFPFSGDLQKTPINIKPNFEDSTFRKSIRPKIEIRLIQQKSNTKVEMLFSFNDWSAKLTWLGVLNLTIMSYLIYSNDGFFGISKNHFWIPLLFIGLLVLIIPFTLFRLKNRSTQVLKRALKMK